MRLYIDTNIIVFLFMGGDDLSRDVRAILNDMGNSIMTSSVCVAEFVHLCQIGKIPISKGSPISSPEGITQWIEALGIDIMPLKKEHVKAMSVLSLQGDHRDPNDRLIIAQAISDRVPLISSDRKFSRYAKYGLDFIFNER